MMYTHEQQERVAKSRAVNTAPFPKENEDLDYLMDCYLRDRKLPAILARINGWYASDSAGDSYARIVIPAKSLVEGHNFWQARAIESQVEKRYQSPSCARLDAIIVVYPLTKQRVNGEAVLVEGPFDALAAAEQGRVGVGLMGNTPSQQVLDHVTLLCRDYKTVMLADSDALQEAGAIVGQLAARDIHIKLRVGHAKDLADSLRIERLRLVRWDE